MGLSDDAFVLTSISHEFISSSNCYKLSPVSLAVNALESFCCYSLLKSREAGKRPTSKQVTGKLKKKKTLWITLADGTEIFLEKIFVVFLRLSALVNYKVSGNKLILTKRMRKQIFKVVLDQTTCQHQRHLGPVGTANNTFWK